MNVTRSIAPLVLGLLLFAAACGGDDDDAKPASNAGASSAGSNPAPTATAGNAGAAATSASSAGDGSVGTVTVGEQIWGVVASTQCSITTVDNLPVVSIAGHAEGEEAVEITIDFDPRDIGLRLTVMGAGGDPSWTAVTETFAVQAGGNRISGEGTFSSGRAGNDAVAGSFEATC